jgi:hypothetical protein
VLAKVRDGRIVGRREFHEDPVEPWFPAQADDGVARRTVEAVTVMTIVRESSLMPICPSR